MEVSPPAIIIIQGEEEYRAEAYDDKRPDYKLKPGDKILGTLTIGYGHTDAARDDDEKIQIGDTVTEEEALEILKFDIAEFSKYVNNRAKSFDVQLTQSQFDALVMASMNRDNSMSGGPLWRAIKSGDEEAIRKEWTKTIEKSVDTFPGLEDRVQEELEIFFGNYGEQEVEEEIEIKMPDDGDPDRGIPAPDPGFVPSAPPFSVKPKEDNSELNLKWTKLYDDLANAFIDNPRTKREQELFKRNPIYYSKPEAEDKTEKVVYDSEEKQKINDNYARLMQALSESLMR